MTHSPTAENSAVLRAFHLQSAVGAVKAWAATSPTAKLVVTMLKERAHATGVIMAAAAAIDATMGLGRVQERVDSASTRLRQVRMTLKASTPVQQRVLCGKLRSSRRGGRRPGARSDNHVSSRPAALASERLAARMLSSARQGRRPQSFEERRRSAQQRCCTARRCVRYTILAIVLVGAAWVFTGGRGDEGRDPDAVRETRRRGATLREREARHETPDAPDGAKLEAWIAEMTDAEERASAAARRKLAEGGGDGAPPGAAAPERPDAKSR